MAERVTTNRSDWSQSLVEAPADPNARATWTRHLATIAAYCDQYQVTDNNPAQPVGPSIEQGRAGHTAHWTAAASALAARQLARTGTVPSSTSQRRTTPLAARSRRTSSGPSRPSSSRPSSTTSPPAPAPPGSSTPRSPTTPPYVTSPSWTR
ncbi:hypothetical protein ACWD5Q_31570 [Streptomyces sp. NPDC002513]